MEKGGYQIIDLKDVNITTTPVKIDGIYRAVSHSCRKVLLLSGLKINGVEMSDEFVKAVRVGTEFLLDAYCVVANNVLTKYDIFVEDDDNVTLQIKQVSSGGTPTPGQSNYTVSSETDDSYDSEFTGQEVDGAIQKIRDVSSTATQINEAITKANKALLTPVQAPTQQTLVGIGTANEQTQVLIGDGLDLTGTTSPRTLKATGTPQHLYKHTITISGHPASVTTSTIYLQSSDPITEHRDVKYPAFCIQKPTQGFDAPNYLYYLLYVECKSNNTITGACLKKDLSDPYSLVVESTMTFNDYSGVTGLSETVEQLF